MLSDGPLKGTISRSGEQYGWQQPRRIPYEEPERCPAITAEELAERVYWEGRHGANDDGTESLLRQVEVQEAHSGTIHCEQSPSGEQRSASVEVFPWSVSDLSGDDRIRSLD